MEDRIEDTGILVSSRFLLLLLWRCTWGMVRVIPTISTISVDTAGIQRRKGLSEEEVLHLLGADHGSETSSTSPPGSSSFCSSCICISAARKRKTKSKSANTRQPESQRQGCGGV